MEKIRKQALENGRLPCVALSICGELWYVVPESVFDSYVKGEE